MEKKAAVKKESAKKEDIKAESVEIQTETLETQNVPAKPEIYQLRQAIIDMCIELCEDTKARRRVMNAEEYERLNIVVECYKALK